MQDAEEVSISVVDKCRFNKVDQFTHSEDSLKVKVEIVQYWTEQGRWPDERSRREEGRRAQPTEVSGESKIKLMAQKEEIRA